MLGVAWRDRLAVELVAFNQNIIPALWAGVAGDEAQVHLEGGNSSAAGRANNAIGECGVSSGSVGCTTWSSTPPHRDLPRFLRHNLRSPLVRGNRAGRAHLLIRPTCSASG